MKEAGSCQLLCMDVNMTEETQAVRWLPAVAFTLVSAYLSCKWLEFLYCVC